MPFTSLKHRSLTRVRRDDGATLMEMALSLPILLSVFFAIMWCSLALYSYFYVSDVARDATRYAMVRGGDQTGDCTTPGYANCIAQTADIQTYVRGLGFPGIQSNNLTVTTTWLTSAGAACGTADTCKVAGNRVKSKVSYAFNMWIPFLKPQSLTFNSTSQAVITY